MKKKALQLKTEGNLALKEPEGTPTPQPEQQHSESVPEAQPTNQDFFDDYRLTVDHLNKEVTYLIDKFLVQQSITMIFARASQGKSFFTLYLTLQLIREGKIIKAVYIDLDNSTMALKSRELDRIIEENPGLAYLHRSTLKVSSSELLEQIEDESATHDGRYDGYLFVLDSIRDFMGGKDMNSDKDVIPVLEKLKAMREAGATIIFLHHSKKDKESNSYKGASAFVDSSDVAYALKKDQVSPNRITFALTIEKDRIAVQDSGFELDTETKTLIPCDYAIASMSDEETEFVSEVREVLAENPGLTQNVLLEKIGHKKDDRTALKRLKNFQGKFWETEKVGQSIQYRALS